MQKIFPQYCSLPFSEIHDVLIDKFLAKKSLVIALPRGFAKSTFAWVFFPTWNVLTGMYRFIVYITSSKERAEEQLKTFRAEMQANIFLNVGIVDIISDRNDAVEYVDTLTSQRVLIKAYGAGQNLRGLRYMEMRPDLVIIDDIENFEEVHSDNYRKKMKAWFYADVLPLSHLAQFCVIGTVMHEDSLLNMLLQAPPEGFVSIRAGVLNENGHSTWPEKYPLSFIEKLKEEYRNKGLLHLFYAEYMNQPVSEETAIFKREYFRYFDLANFDLSQCDIYTAVDLAISKAEEADYTAVVTVAVTPDNAWYVIDIDYGRYDPSEQIEAIFRAVTKWKPRRVGIEKVAYQQALMHFLEKEMRKRNIFFDIVPLVAEKKKEMRIQALQPRFKVGAIYFPERASFLSDLESQLLLFPRAKHDDIIDALAYIEQLTFTPIIENYAVQEHDIPTISAW